MALTDVKVKAAIVPEDRPCVFYFIFRPLKDYIYFRLYEVYGCALR